jgi:hypothetical protein
VEAGGDQGQRGDHRRGQRGGQRPSPVEREQPRHEGDEAEQPERRLVPGEQREQEAGRGGGDERHRGSRSRRGAGGSSTWIGMPGGASSGGT